MGVRAAARALSCIPVRDAMHSDVVTVRSDQTVHELANLLRDHEIGGVPVVSPAGKLVGVASGRDIVEQEARSHVEIPTYYRDTLPEDPDLDEDGFHVEGVDDTPVEDIMTPVVITVEPDSSLGEVARLMVDKHIHRVIVAEEGNGLIEGIVTAGDLIRLIAD